MIDASLVRRLISAQFPEWADRPIAAVELDGWDNRSFRLGTDLVVRLPSDEAYVLQVDKEQRWLPRLAPLLPLPIPTPVAAGLPGCGYPWPWSVYRWLDGEIATAAPIDLPAFAADLGHFLAALQRIDATGGPPPGAHNFFRGGPLQTYDGETRQAIAVLERDIDAGAATAAWEKALSATSRGPPVWLHGDVSASNLLVTSGRPSAVIDFGCSGVGDPACDLAIAWMLFKGESRKTFRAAVPLDDATWTRGLGWTLWKALITVARLPGTNDRELDNCRRVLDELLAEPHLC